MIKMPDVKKLASQLGIKSGRIKKAELIRLIQEAEDNPQCFGTERIQDCPEVSCLWREDCSAEFAKA
ncbi:SAP domain-containing protein [Magnetovirga frankeli]|uniref:SAP domain-containing protein n=1 Tax=Magnetovirga frankeli TaxID=947516 RepID=UPI003D33D71C